jgi:hypothetical protein
MALSVLSPVKGTWQETARYATLAFFNLTLGKISSSCEKAENLFGQAFFGMLTVLISFYSAHFKPQGQWLLKDIRFSNTRNTWKFPLFRQVERLLPERPKYNMLIFLTGTDYNDLNSELMFCYGHA